MHKSIADARRLVDPPSYAFVVVEFQERSDRSGRLLIMVDWHHHSEQLNLVTERVLSCAATFFFGGSFSVTISAGSLGPNKHRD